jgi:hypothetical protein
MHVVDAELGRQQNFEWALKHFPAAFYVVRSPNLLPMGKHHPLGRFLHLAIHIDERASHVREGWPAPKIVPTQAWPRELPGVPEG